MVPVFVKGSTAAVFQNQCSPAGRDLIKTAKYELCMSAAKHNGMPVSLCFGFWTPVPKYQMPYHA